MYGLIGKITAAPGKRTEVIGFLRAGSEDMPGCLSYVVAEDSADEDGIWVTEVWDSETSHRDSLGLPAVRAAITQAKPVIAGFETVAVTRPVGGVGMERG